jgi:membrane peptidoglycan carboxypeptidase
MTMVKHSEPSAPAASSALRRSMSGRSATWWIRRSVFTVGLLGVAAVSGLVFVLWQIPLPPGEPPLLRTTFMCAADVGADCNRDNSMAQLSGGVDRVTVEYEDIPAVFVLALLATEDRQFFEHSGVDPTAVARALVADLRDDGLRQGGSTITQQYVKNAYLSAERTWERKLREAVLAIKLERELPKQEILERYLNTIYWGRGAYGIQAAARTYFGMNADQLGLAESAYLAGIIRSPEAADANRQANDPLFAQQQATATNRRATVLNAMVELGWITTDQRNQVNDMGWDYVLPRVEQTNYGNVARSDIGTEYFVDYTRRWLVANGIFTDDEIYGGGLRIYTTLDLGDQEAAANAVWSTLDRPDDPASALVALDDTGGVTAMYAGNDFNASQVNLALGTFGGGSGRQPGSSYKAIALATALQEGVPLSRTYESPGRMTIPLDGENWDVGNYADGGLGTLNLIDATRVSSNTAYAQLIMDIGVADVVDMSKRMGITAEVPEVPAIVLGAADVSVLDMATAFSVFAQRGERVGPWPVTKVTDDKGSVLWERPVSRERVLDTEVADTMNWVLRQVVESGTGTAARFGQVAAGKTGTAENFRDAWFVGYTCKLTAAVWVGYAGDQTRYMESVHGIEVTGGSFPAQIWRKFMTQAAGGLEDCDFQRPGTAQQSASATTTPIYSVPESTVPVSSTVPPEPSTTQPPQTTTTRITLAPTTVPPTTEPPPPTTEPPPG